MAEGKNFRNQNKEKINYNVRNQNIPRIINEKNTNKKKSDEDEKEKSRE